MNKSVLNTITFCLEDENHKEFNFNGETLTFTLQFYKILAINQVFRNKKLFHNPLDKNTTPVQKKTLMER